MPKIQATSAFSPGGGGVTRSQTAFEVFGIISPLFHLYIRRSWL